MPSDQIPPDPGDFHVLVVDDEVIVREVLHDLIAHSGYRVITVESGQAALKTLADTRIDLVITDLMMPEMNGWQLLKIVKQRYNTLPVVVLTGYISEEGEQMLTNSQIDGYLTKPIDHARLNTMLDTFRKAQKPGNLADITVLDDDPVTLQATEHALTQRGFGITAFQDPMQAVKHIGETKTDLLILDLVMPDIDGFEICRILRENPKTSRLPILILTAAPSRENVARAVKLNVNGFLAKPFNPNILADRVRQILKSAASPNA